MVDEARLRNTLDASVWAQEFCGTFRIFTDEGVIEDQEGLMLSWFANAIEQGRQYGSLEGVRGWSDGSN